MSDQALAAVGLLLVGAFAALGLQALAAAPSPNASTATSPGPTDDTSALSSDSPEDSIAPVSPVLEGLMPRTINGTTLTIQSTVDATNLSDGPVGRALNAAVSHLGKQPSDLEIAVAYDDSGTLDISLLGFRAAGIDAATMRNAILSAWLAAGTSGVTSSSITLSELQGTRISYEDGGADEYVITVGDSVFVLETADATLAQAAAAAIAGSGAVTQAPSASSPVPTAIASPS